MFNIKSRSKYIYPNLVSLIVFITLVTTTISYTNYKKIEWKKDIRTEMQDFLTTKKSKLEKAIYSRIYYTRGVAAYVALNPAISNNEFAELAKEYIKNDSVISSMALSKDCILNAIYPLEGHETALGLNLLDHPERKEIVQKTIETHSTFIAGPVELVEGGIAFISYTPIFDKTKKEQNNFWGVTDIVIEQKSLFQSADLDVSELGYNFALRGYNGKGSEGKIFWGDESIFNNNPVITKIDLPIGNWILAAVPAKGWELYPDQEKVLLYILTLCAFIISILVWLFTRAAVKLKNSEKELKAVFESMDSLIIEFSVEGEYIKINSINEDLLVLPKEELEGKNLSDIFEKEKADFFKNALHECVSKKKLVVIEYPLIIDEKERWFIARLSYKSKNTAIYNSYEITKRKKQEKLLIESEKKLKELNKLKNKFFSIIAHDLRGPLGTHKTIINMILDEYDNLNEKTRKDIIISLQDSSKNLYSLLENLLKWSLSQSGSLKVNQEKFNLNKTYSPLFSHFQKTAELKSIQLINGLDEKATVFADINLTETILRNLISNAIKYTKPEGKVKVGSKKTTLDGKIHHTISISDTGIGVNEKKLKKLFRIDKTESSPGTANETGNGLGLILCKEFAELQGCKINVTSNLNKGSVFSFMLPAE